VQAGVGWAAPAAAKVAPGPACRRALAPVGMLGFDAGLFL
jgi:hypothetical protein